MRLPEKSAALNSLHKKTLYAVGALLWLSGACWLTLSEAHPAKPLLLKIHGAAAMVFLIIFGTLLAEHVPAGWRQNDHRPSGASLMAACCLLILTGWGLYYIAWEQLRHWTSLIHCVLGMLLPAIIFAHVRLAQGPTKRMPGKKR